jgi:hypothetical protein
MLIDNYFFCIVINHKIKNNLGMILYLKTEKIP